MTEISGVPERLLDAKAHDISRNGGAKPFKDHTFPELQLEVIFTGPADSADQNLLTIQDKGIWEMSALARRRSDSVAVIARNIMLCSSVEADRNGPHQTNE